MSQRRTAWILVGVLHLAIVVLGALSALPDRRATKVAQGVRWYATMSGANSSFGFFAPEVGAAHRARFLLQDDQGSAWWDTFDQAGSPDAWLRLTGIVEAAFMTGPAHELPELRQELVKSWAATMFTRHPRAVSLTAVVEAYEVPTMAAYRAGARPNWQTVYQAQLQRSSPVIQERIKS